MLFLKSFKGIAFTFSHAFLLFVLFLPNLIILFFTNKIYCWFYWFLLLLSAVKTFMPFIYAVRHFSGIFLLFTLLHICLKALSTPFFKIFCAVYTGPFLVLRQHSLFKNSSSAQRNIAAHQIHTKSPSDQLVQRGFALSILSNLGPDNLIITRNDYIPRQEMFAKIAFEK